MPAVNIAVVGATGAVGQMMLTVLEERQFPAESVHALASAASVGKTVAFTGRDLTIENMETFDFSQVDIALFAISAELAADYAPKAAKMGCVVIDNSSHFRQDPRVPLIIPEVNPEYIGQYQQANIIANPNCSTIQMLVALKPLYDAVGISRINVATYQAVSGTGRDAIEELREQTAAVLHNEPIQCEVYAKPIAFNVLPQIDQFTDNGYTREEMKMLLETQKILLDPNIKVNATAVRVPVFNGHSEAINIETSSKLSVVAARAILQKAPGVELMDDPENEQYPTPKEQASDDNTVYIGRIREDISHPKALNLWVVGDNLRKGAALNAVQIAELLVQQHLKK